MNDKLAQAVKLYDHILTQQVLRPTWRQQTASPPAQPLSQWNYVQSPTPTQPTSTYTPLHAYQPPTGPGPSYAPPPHSPPQTWTQPSHVSSVANSPPITTASQASPQYYSGPTPQPSVSQQYQYAHPIQPASIQQPHPPMSAPTNVITPQQPASAAAQPPPVHRHASLPPSVHHRQQ